MKYPTQEEIDAALAGMPLDEGQTEFVPPSAEELEADYHEDERLRR